MGPGRYPSSNRKHSKCMVSNPNKTPANSADSSQTAHFQRDAEHEWVKVDSVKMLCNFGKNKTKKNAFGCKQTCFVP